MKPNKLKKLKGKRVLVTGGAGFIGCNLVRRLLKERVQVRVFDNFSTGKRDNLKDLVTGNSSSPGRPVSVTNSAQISDSVAEFSVPLQVPTIPSASEGTYCEGKTGRDEGISVSPFLRLRFTH